MKLYLKSTASRSNPEFELLLSHKWPVIDSIYTDVKEVTIEPPPNTNLSLTNHIEQVTIDPSHNTNLSLTNHIEQINGLIKEDTALLRIANFHDALFGVVLIDQRTGEVQSNVYGPILTTETDGPYHWNSITNNVTDRFYTKSVPIKLDYKAKELIDIFAEHFK